jgi:hypothetical protein
VPDYPSGDCFNALTPARAQHSPSRELGITLTFC